MRTKTTQKRFPLRGSYSPKGPAFFIYLNYYLHMTHSFQILIFMIVKDLNRYYIFFFAIIVPPIGLYVNKIISGELVFISLCLML